MVNLIEIVDRALEGPFTSESDFDLDIFVSKLRELTKKYDIRYPRRKFWTVCPKLLPGRYSAKEVRPRLWWLASRKAMSPLGALSARAELLCPMKRFLRAF
jgi:hypothetical protein